MEKLALADRATVICDTETTGLHDDCNVWDIGMIVRAPGADRAHDMEIQIIVTDADFSDATAEALEIGKARERHPAFGVRDRRPAVEYMTRRDAAEVVEATVRDAIIVGIVPSFDERALKKLLRDNGYPWFGYYDLRDAKQLACGWLLGARAAGKDVPHPASVDWKSEQVSELMGIPRPGDADRHTAIGDARWARDLYDVVMASSAAPPL